MSKIRIVNWLLTRRCNLNCDYCAIVRNYDCMPIQYPPIKHYIKNEMTTEVVINALRKFKMHNPNIFNIFYGGEPLLRRDLPEIINYCNDHNIYYTIISNNTPEIQPQIDRLFKETDYVEGFTSSVDPVIFDQRYLREDRVKKSIEGMKRLKEIQEKGDVKDVVAEITVMDSNKHLLYDLVAELSSHGIYSDITFVDIAKNTAYDFSNVRTEYNLVKPTWDLAKMLMKIMDDDNLLVHMKDVLIPKMFDSLPSCFDCKIEDELHTICIDSDSTLRMCLRIRGVMTPKIFNLSNIFDESYPTRINNDIYSAIKADKVKYCKLCNHSCYMMGEYVNNSGKGSDDLIHKEKREK